MNNPYDLRNTKETRLLKFLRTDGNAYPVIFKNGQTETEVRWNNYLEADAMTELHVSGDTVHISKRFHMDHQVVPPIAAGPFVFDLRIMLLVSSGGGGMETVGRPPVCLLLRLRRDEIALSETETTGFLSASPFTDFQRINLFIPAELEKLFLQSTLFLTDGREVEPELSSSLSYLLGIKRIGTP